MNEPRQRRRVLARRLLALLLGYVLAELILVPIITRTATVRILKGLPRPMQVLAQTSKKALVPREYTLLLGDSYAEGQGDWLTAAVAQGGKPPYQAAHVIHERTGEDVITFGVGGAGSVTSLVGNPLKRREALRRFFVSAPRRVLAYFYEGNDLDNNLDYVQRHLLGEGEGLELLDAQRIDDHLRHSLALRSRVGGLFGNLYVPGLLQNTFELLFDSEDPAPDKEPVPESVNLARVAGEVTPLAKAMQAPSLELTPDELDLGLLVFERSLAFCREIYSEAEMTVVYIPSPLSCYELASERVDVQPYHGRSTVYPSPRVQERSREIRNRVRSIIEKARIDFLDLTPAMQELARTTCIHGPREWKHFNAAGYTRMGEEIVQRVSRSAP